MTKLCCDIILNSSIIEIIGNTNIPVNSICFDSRNISKGSLFVAIKGIKVDGHIFISDAINAGAVVIVCEVLPPTFSNNVTYIKVKDSSYALGIITSNFYDNPSSKLNLVGVTGTNGKTTTVTLLYNLFMKLGYKTGLISTVRNFVNNKEYNANYTTPDAVSLNKLLDMMVKEGCTHCFMEVSSHAISQKRIAGITFSAGVFTNITHDHLDFHKSFDEYLKAKKSFFDSLPPSAFALSNADDKNGNIMLQNTKASKYYYSLNKNADFRCKILENSFTGMLLLIDNTEMWTRLVGKFNAYNILVAYATAVLMGIDKKETLTVLSNIKGAEGRFECVTNDKNIIGIVDYAHTPDALKNVLSTIIEINEKQGKIITVVGAGGDRDKTKRPVMAAIVCELSDKIILTSDNPRSENSNDIIEDMKKGVKANYWNKVIVITDRREAIKTACSLANSNDIILVAGKGHEKYQEIKGIRTHFDDMEILKKCLNINLQ